jgi:hypothetical protein
MIGILTVFTVSFMLTVLLPSLCCADRNTVRTAYSYAEFMSERKKMMQSWADYLDSDQVRAKDYSVSHGGVISHTSPMRF